MKSIIFYNLRLTKKYSILMAFINSEINIIMSIHSRVNAWLLGRAYYIHTFLLPGPLHNNIKIIYLIYYLEAPTHIRINYYFHFLPPFFDLQYTSVFIDNVCWS